MENNKVVVPEFVAEWYEEIATEKLDGNDMFRIIQDVLKVGDGVSTWNDYNVDEKLVRWVEKNEKPFLNLIVNCEKGIGYVVKPQKYYWRKKKEHLAWFEEEDKTYLNRYVFKNIPSYIKEISLEDNDSDLRTGYDTEFTEQEAQDLLKDDFDKFEKVEIE